VVEPRESAFDPAAFLAGSGLGRRIVQFKPKQLLFSQGDSADSIFYVRKGRAKLTVVSKSGKEATIAVISAEDFVGEESIAGAVGLRLATATAITAQDREGGDYPCSARRACILRSVSKVSAGP
jgi:CRP/FNR family cyclic AMP-dependent transcriptional regulator